MKGLDQSPTVSRSRRELEFHIRVQGPRQGKEVANPDCADEHTGKAMFVPDSQRCVQGEELTHTTPAFLFAASDHFHI